MHGARQKVSAARGDLEVAPPAVAIVARSREARAWRGHAQRQRVEHKLRQEQPTGVVEVDPTVLG